MRYEMNDYRKPKKQPSWFDWKPIMPAAYLFKMLLFLFFIPALLGFMFSPIGLLSNCILIDYILYHSAITRREY